MAIYFSCQFVRKLLQLAKVRMKKLLEPVTGHEKKGKVALNPALLSGRETWVRPISNQHGQTNERARCAMTERRLSAVSSRF